MGTPPERPRMLRDDLIRLEHIAAACADITIMVNGHKREDLNSDMILRRAIIHAIQEIGEASTKITLETRELAPTVPWGSIVATRNIVVHVYWGVDLDQIWNMAISSVPSLLSSIRAVMDQAIPYELD